jgi:tetratricopeptide (TPR) repeat protein
LHDLDSLHQRASARYLQGDLQAALEAWRQVLQLAPDDTRALEGVRLCRDTLEARGDEDAVDDFAELDAKLDLGQPASATPRTAEQESPGVDLAWALESGAEEQDASPAPPAPPRPAAGACSWDFCEGEPEPDEPPLLEPLPLPVPMAPSPPEERDDGQAAAMQLRRRANELLANALVAMEAGSHDEAVRTLDRLLILDDGNEAARDLKHKIAAEHPSGTPIPGAAAADPATDGFAPIELDDPTATESLDRSRPPVPVTELPDEDLGESGEPDASAEAGFAEEPESPPPAAVSATSTRRMQIRLPLDRRLLGIGALVVLGLAAGLYLLSGSGGSTPTVDAQAAAAAAARARVDASKPAEGGVTIGSEGAAARPAAEASLGSAPSDTTEIESRVAAATREFEAGNWAAAIVAYNAVLKLDPTQVEAQARLREAGERYQAARELEERWRSAREAFANADFREALRLSYRLPADEDPAQLERVRFNGWYNLGLQALDLGDCKAAREHFAEAKQIRDDPALAEAPQLAKLCSGDADYRRRVASLEPRGFDD